MQTSTCRAAGATCLLLSLVAPFLAAQQPAAPAPTTPQVKGWGRYTDPTAVPIVLTIEGGGSLGVYEAGMTWALVELFKRQQGLSTRDERFPKVYLASVSGASAGSINALLAATSWCDASQPDDPEHSPFWQTWVPTGISQLLPRAKPREGQWGRGENGIFSREYFDSVLFKRLASSWADSTPGRWHAGCRVPLGATMTRLIADTTMTLTKYIRVRNQRFGVSVDVRTDSDARRLTFVPRPADLGQLSFGRIIGLPTNAAGLISAETLLPVFKASSGYPLAFEPQRVTYLQTGASYPCDGSCDTTSALFVDGGVFDNGPIALGLGLYFDGPFWGEAGRRSPRPFPFVLFMTPDERRDLIARRAETVADSVTRSTPLKGVSAVLRLASEAVPVARQYELQTLIRMIKTERSPIQSPCARDNDRTLCFLVTDRFHPLMGSRMGGFGGFLGRPFRELDFYVGVYDALALVARFIGTEDGSCVETGGGRDSTVVTNCVAIRLAQLIAEPPMRLGTVAPTMLRKLYRSEFGRDADRPGMVIAQQGSSDETGAPIVTPADSTIAVLSAVHAGMMQLMHDSTAQDRKRARLQVERCAVTGALGELMCVEGLHTVLRTVRDDRRAKAIIDRWRNDPACRFGRVPESLSQSERCRADARLLSLLSHPVAETHGIVRAILRRADHGTPHGKQMGAGSTIAHVAGLAYLSADGRYRRGWDMGQTSLPHMDSPFWNIFWRVAPSSVAFPLGAYGMDLGWETRYNFGDTFSLVAPLRVRFSTLKDDDDDRVKTTRATSGIGIEARINDRKLSSVRVDGLMWERLDARPDNSVALRDKMGVGVSAFLFSSKIRLSLETRPASMRGTYMPIGSVGIGDVNGILHWMSLRRSEH